MDEPDLHKPKSLLEDSVISSADGINIEDDQYSTLREDLEADARDFEAPTWSLAVDQQYLKDYSKEAIKRQDVIHELIQTEINHVRTLKLMLRVYSYEVSRSLQKEEVQLERLFPCLDHLLREHQHFLNRLKQRRRDSLEPGSQQNYCIKRLGDILVSQFSGELKSRLLDGYGVFCSCHTDAVNYYKELLQNNKKFQTLIKKIGQLAIVRRLGVTEGILLITQRITKYPVLLERLIKNTEVGTEEYEDLVLALDRLKETLSQVDEQVHDYEKLRELVSRLEPKSVVRMKSGQVYPREELLQHGRRILREGLLSWKSQNRPKVSDVIVVLLSDLLLLLQEKDQKLMFASLDGKPAVLSLQKLIVREAAFSERVMYLISTSDEKAEMYEFHTTTGEERTNWKRQIWQAIESFSHVDGWDEEDFVDPEDMFSEKLRGYHEQLCVSDAQITEQLQVKLRLFTDLAEMITDTQTLPKRLLVNCSSAELQQGEQLLNSSIAEVEGLQSLLLSSESDHMTPSIDTLDTGLQPRKVNTIAGFTKSGESQDGFRNRNQRPNSDPQLRDLYLDNLELSADDETAPVWNSPQQAHIPQTLLYETVARLTQKLYSLQVVVSQQDSEVEVLRTALSERPGRFRGNGLLVQEKQRHLEQQREELQQLQRVYSQQRQEQLDWQLERQQHLQETQQLQLQLRLREEACAGEEARLAAQRDLLARNREEYQQDLERLRESTRAVEKLREKLEQQEEKMKKYKKHNTISNMEPSIHLHSAQSVPATVDLFLSPKPHVRPSLAQVFQERPPLVPPRKESIGISPVKTEVPIQLVSTTNQFMKSSSVQQQIPTKLAGKGKEKSKNKSHHRTNSAASIEVSSVVPIKGGKEGGSLRAKMSTSPRPNAQDIYFPPEQILSTKPPPHSSSTHSARKPSQASSNNTPAHHRVKESSSKEDIYYI